MKKYERDAMITRKYGRKWVFSEENIRRSIDENLADVELSEPEKQRIISLLSNDTLRERFFKKLNAYDEHGQLRAEYRVTDCVAP